MHRGKPEKTAEVVSERKRRIDCIAETPIILPILHAAGEHHGTLQDSGFSFSEGSETKATCALRMLDHSVLLDSDCSSTELSYLSESCSGFDSKSNLTLEAKTGIRQHRLSVSFGDVTVCDKLEEELQRPSWHHHKSLPSLSVTQESFNIDDIILAAATPPLDDDQPKTTLRKSLIQRVGSFPDWLANKPILGSFSSLASSRSNLQGSDAPSDSGGAHSSEASEMPKLGLPELLGQVRQGRCRQVRRRVLQPSATLGAFGDWKDVENSTLVVSNYTILFLMVNTRLD